MVQTSKYTPGPWYEASTGNHQGLIIDENTGENIAIAYDKANAPLIAAAPDMLQTLKACQVSLMGDEDYAKHRDLFRTIDTAIAKAEGRQP